MTTKNNPPPAPSAMTVRAYAKSFGVTRRTIWRWVKCGYLDADRLAPRTGVRVRIKPRGTL